MIDVQIFFKSLYDLIRIHIRIKAHNFLLAEQRDFPEKRIFIVHFCRPNHCLEMETCTLTWSCVIEYVDIEEVGENTRILITLIPCAAAAEGSGRSTPRRNYNEANVETTGKT